MLWMTPTASAQIVSQQTKTVKSAITDGNSISGSTTYHYSMTVTLTGPQYVTYDNPGQVTERINASTSMSAQYGLFPPPARGTQVEYFGSGGSIGLFGANEKPFISSITVKGPDTFGAGQCAASVDTGLGNAWSFSFGVSYKGLGLNFSPPPPGCPISLQAPASGLGEIDVADTVNNAALATGAKTEDGIF